MSEPITVHVTPVLVQPGDVLVCRYEGNMSPDLIRALITSVRDMFPNHKCLVLDGGIRMEVWRESQ